MIGNPSIRRLQPKDAAESRWHADRPGAVRSLMDRADASGGAHSRARARRPRVHAVLPGIVGNSGKGTVAVALPTEFGDGGLADRDRTGISQALYVHMIDVRH